MNTTLWLRVFKCSPLILAAGLVLAVTSSSHAQTLLLSLQSKNYNASTGVWTDTSGTGHNATVSGGGGNPFLVANDTPNGSSTVYFSGGQQLTLALGGIATQTSYTAFVFLRPGSGGTMFSGSNGSLQYRISGGKQDVVQEFQADAGAGTATVSTTAFSSLNVATGASGTNYRLNGAADGTTSAVTFSSAITTIGNQGNGNEYFTGEIAEIDIYSGVLTTAQRQTVEAQLTASYVTPLTVPEPGTWATVLIGFAALLGVQFFRARKA